MASDKPTGLQPIDPTSIDEFDTVVKKINGSSDVEFFLTSKAYTDIVTFLLQLNASLFPRKSEDFARPEQTWELGCEAIPSTSATIRLAELLSELETYIAKAPPDPGPCRFGNTAFRKWCELAADNADFLLKKYVPHLEVGTERGAHKELKPYLLGSFGSAQRLDYGTGHELSFLAFLAALWKLGGIKAKGNDYLQERALVLHVIQPYFNLIRLLIKTYNLEPAGSHGVWGLDDHSFLPYIFGSAQLGPPITNVANPPQEGSSSTAPDPGDVMNASIVERERQVNMYFSAVGFIYDIKKGPFWEHSPMLYDISGIRAGWAKINKGMIKMYIAEVLSKFPVVQHFPFGQVFKWERDPNAASYTGNIKYSAGTDPATPSTAASSASAARGASTTLPPAQAPRMANPYPPSRPVGSASADMAPTRAPWAKPNDESALPPTRAPWTGSR